MTEATFTTVFARALQGHPCQVIEVDGYDEPRLLPVSDWARAADRADHLLLDRCVGATLDIGCGPGRLSERLAELGHVALGIDVVPEAVAQTIGRGATALRRNVFDVLPGEGRWRTALLADGNIGIGGDPVTLLRRVRELLDPRGRVVVEVAAPGTGLRTTWAVLTCGDERSRPFRWSVVGLDARPALAAEAGLREASHHGAGGRWCSVLEEER
jgi:SAM-dependent methyltransferase